jgi:3-oxoacyl-[acyl-carrier protein] reductase
VASLKFSAYAATKGVVDTMVKHFAATLGTRGIRVNAVAPGLVDTDMRNFTKAEAGRAVNLGMQALKRLAQPNDIAPVVAFLASDDALGHGRFHSRRRRSPARTEQ